MKYAPPKEFENAEPLTDFRYFLSENQPLHVRFFKAVIDSKIIFRTLMGTGLTVAGVAAADVAWGGHDLTQVLSCNVSYIDTDRQRLVQVMHNTSQKTMDTVLSGCEQTLNSIDGENRVFVEYSSDSGTVIPGLAIIEGAPESIGLKSHITAGENPQEDLSNALAQNESDQRWLVENYMRIAGRPYSAENISFAINQAGYEISDSVKYTIDDIGYWFGEQRDAAAQRWNQLWAQSPN